MNDPPGALDGVRVLDCSQMLAGPLCGMRLGDLGADVVKVEPPGAGEWTRRHPLAGVRQGGETLGVLSLNRNKRSVALDLKTERGRELLHRLVERSDVLVQNFRVGAAERLGMGYEQLREVNPRLVYCAISAYGESGPYVDRPGQDLVVQGYSGSMWTVGTKDGPPVPGALYAVDVLTGYQATVGILAALEERRRSGRGQKVSTNMLATILDCQIQELTTHLNTGLVPERGASTHAHGWIPAPYGVFQTADGWVTVSMAPLALLGPALDAPELAEFGEWSFADRDLVTERVGEVVRRMTSAELMERLDRSGLWSGPVYDYADVVADPHVVGQGLLSAYEHPTAGTVRTVAPPVHLSRTDTAVRRPAPLLGEHTDAVLAEIGVTEQERDELVASEVVGRLAQPSTEYLETEGAHG